MLGCDTCLQNICDKHCRLGRIWVDMVRFANSEGFLDCEFAPNIVDLIANLEQMGYIISHDYGLADTYLVRVLSRNGVACISEKHDEMNWFVADETEEDSEQELN